METEWQTEPKQIRWSREKYEGRGFAESELVEEQSKEYVALFQIFLDSTHIRKHS